MNGYEDLYDMDDYGDDMEAGDDCNRLIGRHSASECAMFRDEMARRETAYKALGCGREYRRLMQAERPRSLSAGEPKIVPHRRRLPAPAPVLTTADPEEEDAA